MDKVKLIISKWKSSPGSKPDYCIDVVEGGMFSGGIIRLEDFTLEKIAATAKDVLQKLSSGMKSGWCSLKIEIRFESEFLILGTPYYSQNGSNIRLSNMNDSVFLKMPLSEGEILLFYKAFEYLRSHQNVRDLK